MVFALCMSISGVAQNVWEKPEQVEETPAQKTKKEKKEKKAKKKEGKQTAAKTEKKAKPQKEVKLKEDPKYLRGAAPMVNGRICWTLDLDVPGKDAQQIYDLMYKYLDRLTKQENQLEGSCISLINRQDHIIVAGVREWLVFKDQFLVLDRAKIYYTLIATCTDGHLNMTMDRISYRYEENNGKSKYTYKAEDWIADENAVNKKGTDLYPGSAKFRRKTIDRKDELFHSVKEALLGME